MIGQIFSDFINVFKCPLAWLTNVSIHKLRPGRGVLTDDLCAVRLGCRFSELLS